MNTTPDPVARALDRDDPEIGNPEIPLDKPTLETLQELMNNLPKNVPYSMENATLASVLLQHHILRTLEEILIQSKAQTEILMDLRRSGNSHIRTV